MASQTHSAPAMPEEAQQHRAELGPGCLVLLLEDCTPPQRIHFGLLDEVPVMGLGIC